MQNMESKCNMGIEMAVAGVLAAEVKTLNQQLVKKRIHL